MRTLPFSKNLPGGSAACAAGAASRPGCAKAPEAAAAATAAPVVSSVRLEVSMHPPVGLPNRWIVPIAPAAKKSSPPARVMQPETSQSTAPLYMIGVHERGKNLPAAAGI